MMNIDHLVMINDDNDIDLEQEYSAYIATVHYKSSQ